MFTKKEMLLFEELKQTQNYQILRITEDYCEFRSRSTWHCWIIKKEPACLGLKYPYTIYHKHKPSDYYHRHWQSFSFERCINSIESHDDYVLRTEKLLEKCKKK